MGCGASDDPAEDADSTSSTTTSEVETTPDTTPPEPVDPDPDAPTPQEVYDTLAAAGLPLGETLGSDLVPVPPVADHLYARLGEASRVRIEVYASEDDATAAYDESEPVLGGAGWTFARCGAVLLMSTLDAGDEQADFDAWTADSEDALDC